MEMLLNTVRKVDYDQLKEYAQGDENSLKDNLAICFLNPNDFKKLGLTSSLNLKLSNENGEVIIKVKQDENVPSGTIMMPVSIWASQLTGVYDESLVFKNLEINAEPTRERVFNIAEVLESIR
ncbi:MAG: molybdopterin dinucleotide binding domain-containing protein [Promethearchaeota archaeon]